MNLLKRHLAAIAAGAVLMIVPAYAQTTERRATFAAGSGDTGKCTIEVYVDGSAEVEIRGDRGLLRTLNGQQAQWRRFVCSGPMPANPGEFRFIGVDGRGRQALIQGPENGRGDAVVKIQDPNGGGEGYTFDLVWRTAGFARPQPRALTFPLIIGRDRGASPDLAPGFDKEHWPDMVDQTWGNQIFAYYGAKPYWEGRDDIAVLRRAGGGGA